MASHQPRPIIEPILGALIVAPWAVLAALDELLEELEGPRAWLSWRLRGQRHG